MSLSLPPSARRLARVTCARVARIALLVAIAAAAVLVGIIAFERRDLSSP